MAAKCTSKLQITDSDFAKQFKALVRKKLLALRRDFQHAQKNTSSMFKVGALEIVTSVAGAQQEMTAKNRQDQWVLRLLSGMASWPGGPTLRQAGWRRCAVSLDSGFRTDSSGWRPQVALARQTGPSVILLRPSQTLRKGLRLRET